MDFPFAGADEGTRAFRGAPRCTAHRAVQFAAIPFASLYFARKPIALAIASTLESRLYSIHLKRKRDGFFRPFPFGAEGGIRTRATIL